MALDIPDNSARTRGSCRHRRMIHASAGSTPRGMTVNFAAMAVSPVPRSCKNSDETGILSPVYSTIDRTPCSITSPSAPTSPAGACCNAFRRHRCIAWPRSADTSYAGVKTIAVSPANATSISPAISISRSPIRRQHRCGDRRLPALCYIQQAAARRESRSRRALWSPGRVRRKGPARLPVASLIGSGKL